MFRAYKSLHEINFSQLMVVYQESNRQNARELYHYDDMNVALLRVEQNFYSYLKEDFFQIDGSFYGIWEQGQAYISALRMEPYKDGWLLTGLETAPDYRNRGLAKSLINASVSYLSKYGNVKIYSHVLKTNKVSLKTHASCGFKKVLDYAAYIDGSVLYNSVTLLYENLT